MSMITEKLKDAGISIEEGFDSLALLFVIETGRDMDTIVDNLILAIQTARELADHD